MSLFHLTVHISFPIFLPTSSFSIALYHFSLQLWSSVVHHVGCWTLCALAVATGLLLLGDRSS